MTSTKESSWNWLARSFTSTAEAPPAKSVEHAPVEFCSKEFPDVSERAKALLTRSSEWINARQIDHSNLGAQASAGGTSQTAPTPLAAAHDIHLTPLNVMYIMKSPNMHEAKGKQMVSAWFNKLFLLCYGLCSFKL